MIWNIFSHESANIALPVYRLPTGFYLRADGVVELFHLHCVDDVQRVLCVQLSFGDFVDQLLALDLSGLACDQRQACLLVFSVAVAFDCPQTVRQLLVQRVVDLFAAGSWLS